MNSGCTNVSVSKYVGHLNDALMDQYIAKCSIRWGKDQSNLPGNLVISVQYCQLSDLPDIHHHDLYDYLVFINFNTSYFILKDRKPAYLR